MRDALNEADFAMSFAHGEADDLHRLASETYNWTGWKNRHWPADIVRPGMRLYAYDLRSNRRNFFALLEVTRGGSFHYRTKREFSNNVKSLTGWMPLQDDPHWKRIPLSRRTPCVGLTLRWKLIKRLDVPRKLRFPRLGWLRLIDGSHLQAVRVDTADLYPEGRRFLRSHIAIERNARLRRDAKEYWRRKMGGRLKCKACDFDFETAYGAVGADFIEMHHTQSLAGDTPRKKRVVDLVPVCSNCHRIIHREPLRPLSLQMLVKSIK